MRKHFLLLMLMALLPLAGWADGSVTITPNVINVYYPATAVPAATVENFTLSGDVPVGEGKFETMAAAKANLVRNLEITLVANAKMPDVTGSVKYYFSVVGDNLDARWNGITFNMAYNGDLNVLPRDLATVNFSVPDGPDVTDGVYTYTYNGSAKTPKPIVYVGNDPADEDSRLIEGTDFQFTYIHNTDANGVVVMEGVEPNVVETTVPQIKIVAATNKGYAGFKTLDFTINPKAFGTTDVTIADITGATYKGGDDVKPTLTVTDAAISNKVLALGVDYEIDLSYDDDGWKNNTNATPANASADQLASVQIKGKGNYKAASTLLKTFSIAKKNIADSDIDWDGVVAQLNYPVAANAQAAANIRWHGADAAIAGIKYELSNTESIGLGTITASIITDGAANYTGTKTTNFEIIPGYINQNVTIEFKKANPEFNPAQPESNSNPRYLNDDQTFVYKGEEIKPGTIAADGELKVTKTVGDNAYILKKGVDYVIVENGYKNNINATASGAEEANKPTVTIKGIGNFDAVDANSKPITKTATFTISKRPIEITATDVTKVYSKPEIPFDFTTNIIAADYDKLYAKVPTYTVYLNTEGEEIPTEQEYDAENGYSALQATTVEDGEGDDLKWCFIDNEKKNWYTITPALDFEDNEELAAHDPALTEDELAEIAAARANYDFENGVVAHDGKLKVERASYILAVVNRSKIYGSTAETGASAQDAVRFDNTKAVDEQDTYYTYQVLEKVGETETVVNNVTPATAPKLGRKLAGNETALPEDVKEGGYTIYVLNNLDGQTGKFIDPNFDFTVRTGTLTIEPFKLTLVANDQTIKYGAQPNLGVSATDKVKDAVNGDAQGFGNQLTITFSPAMTGKGLITRAELDLHLDIDEAFDGTIDTHADVLIPSLGADVKNYVIDETTLVLGDIKVISAGELTLGRSNEKCHDLIKDYDGRKNLTVKFEERPIPAETWQAMAFPFDLTVAEFSNAIFKATNGEGYAVVNILNEETPAGGKPAFKLWMRDIPANTPFLFKVYTGKNGETLNGFDMKDLEFVIDDNNKIKYEEQAESHDAAGNYFYGLYKVTTVTNDGYTWLFNHNKGKFGKFGKKVGEEFVYDGQTSLDLNPLTGYLKTATQIDQFARITVVEEDGTVTAISTINADGVAVEADGWYNLNGVKLQGMPTEKGVYIQNGKKVVLK